MYLNYAKLILLLGQNAEPVNLLSRAAEKMYLQVTMWSVPQTRAST